MKKFNITGPCIPDKHYMLDAESRLVDIHGFIDDEQFFVIHAARQSGKTTLLNSLENTINNAGKYYALYCSLEAVQAFPEPERGIPQVLNCLKKAIRISQLPTKTVEQWIDYHDLSNSINSLFIELCSTLDKPLVVLFDEVHYLSGGTLITFLSQLRTGFINRIRAPFIHSLALVGMGNISDYHRMLRNKPKNMVSVSPFNIVAECLTLKKVRIQNNFSPSPTDSASEKEYASILSFKSCIKNGSLAASSIS